jgi:hypothetical protein
MPKLLPLGAGKPRRLLDRLGILAGGSDAVPLLAAANAPTLTLTSGATDNQPDFLVTAANADLPVNAVVTIYAYTDAGLTTLEDTGTGTVTVAGTLTVTNQLGPLADGAKWYVARTSITGHATSSNSNTETNTIDATAPTLSSVTGTKTGTTTADLSASTNEANGTLFGVVTTSATTPTATQVKTGKDHTGSSAAFAYSQAVSATGAQPASATGLTASTTYYHHPMHEDSVGNQSSVGTSSSFTTDAVAGVTVDATDATKHYIASGVGYTDITVGSGSHRALVLTLNFDGVDPTGVSVTWNGTAMTEINGRSAASNRRSSLWGLVNPASGANAFAISWTGGGNVFAMAIAFTGVNQTGGATSFPNSAVGAAITLDITSATGDKVVCASCSGPSEAPTGTLLYEDHTTGSVISGMAQYASGAATVTIGDANGGLCNIVATNVKAG